MTEKKETQIKERKDVTLQVPLCEVVIRVNPEEVKKSNAPER